MIIISAIAVYHIVSYCILSDDSTNQFFFNFFIDDIYSPGFLIVMPQHVSI